MSDFATRENWQLLETISGDASHVPNALAGLLSNNENEFDASYWRLENHVVVQSDLYSAAAVLPKYLEEIFLKAKFKYGVLELLFQIGNGSSNDKALEETCYISVVEVLERLHNNSDLSANVKEKIEDDLLELKAFRNEQRNAT